MYNIAIIDDSRELLTELSDYFNQSERIRCVLSLSTVDGFLKYYRDFMNIELVLLDIILFEKSGIDGIPLIINKVKKETGKEVMVVILSVLDDKEAVFQALSYGAKGYLVKGLSLYKLETSLISALEDGVYPISNEVVRHLVRYFQLSEEVSTELNPQEFSIARMLADGMTYQAIADLILMSINGVRYHVKNIYRKLGVDNRQELKRLLNDNGESRTKDKNN